jgi:cytochrome c biogenesis factor
VAIRRGLCEDLYVNFAGMDDGSDAAAEAYVFPLVDWIWIGTPVLAGGTLIALAGNG